MIISVTNRSIRRQSYQTSCWISAAHYVLQYLDVAVSLSTLHAQYYAPNPQSQAAMTGAGRPRNILSAYAFDAGYFAATMNAQTSPRQQVLDAIAENIRNNIPVIASIRTQQIAGFGHAIVITAVDPASGTIGFKDPAAINSSRNFSVDVRSLSYDEFVNGFSYRYHPTMRTQIYCYCSAITYLRPLDQMNLFD